MPDNDGKRVWRHWRVFGLVTVAFVALVAGVYAYWRYASSPSSGPYAVAVSPPLELRIELDKTEFQLGEKVVIRLFLKNIGSENITLSFNNWNDQVGFVVKDKKNKEVFVYPEVFLPAVKDVTLKPGDQISETFEWHQKGNRPENYGVPVTSGTYKVIGRTGRFALAGQGRERIETPAIAITIG